jgi:hypothetical protein
MAPKGPSLLRHIVFLHLALAMLAAGCTDTALRGYAESTEELGQAVVDALNGGDKKALHALRAGREEYVTVLYPAFPKTAFDADFAWNNLNRKCTVGVEKWLRRFGRRDLTFTGIRFERPTESYEGLRLHRGTVLSVRLPDGETRDLEILGSVVEREGRFKLLSYDD